MQREKEVMGAVPIFLLSRYLATNSGYHKYFATVEGGARNSRLKDKGMCENSDVTTEGDSIDIDVDEPCTLECL